MTSKKLLVIACASMALTIVLGAFGAHALKASLPANLLNAYQTGVTYQAYHSLALLVLGVLAERHSGKWFNISSALMLVGMCLFSGSLYALALSGVTQLGMVTPIGGVLLIAAWSGLGVHFWKRA